MIEIPRFSGAYNAIDIHWLPAVGTGIVLPIGAGYVFYTYLKTKEEKKGRNRLLAWFYMLMALEAAILIPWGVSRLRNVPLASVVTPGIDWLWTAVVMISPFLMASAVVNGIALQVVKQKAETKDQQLPISKEAPIQSKPLTRDEFLNMVKRNPAILNMNSTEVMKEIGAPVCQKTAYNWLVYAKEHNGNHS